MRVVVLFILSAQFVLACALCQLVTPTAHVYTDFKLNQNELSAIDVKWVFSENFTQLTLRDYDENFNKKFDPKELSKVKEALVDYLRPRKYLTFLGVYDDNNSVMRELKFSPTAANLEIKDGVLRFSFSLKTSHKLYDKLVIAMNTKDFEGYFNFTMIAPKAYEIAPNLQVVANANLSSLYFEFLANSGAKPVDLPKLVDSSNIKSPKFAPPDESLSLLATTNLEFLNRFETLIKQNSTNPSIKAFFLIVLISFLYGFIHAAGPGHAKSLSAFYFSTQDSSKALTFALKIGFLHVSAAMILVVSMLGITENFAANELKSGINLSLRISSIIIICVGIFLIYKALFLHTHQCGCSVCKSRVKSANFKEWLVVFAGALIPCPGVVMAFALAFSTNNLAICLVSGLMMGLGMSAVVFISSVFGLQINKFGFKKSNLLGKIISVMGAIFMLILGIFMYISSLNVGVI